VAGVRRRIKACEMIGFGLGRQPRPAPTHVTIAALAIATGLSRGELVARAIAGGWPAIGGSRLRRGPRAFLVAAMPDDLQSAFNAWYLAQQDARLGVTIRRRAA
jgi:hypothetical protein